MVRIFLFLVFLLFAATLMAQPKTEGSKISDVKFKDINGKEFSLYEYLDQGYAVFVDISATWCGPCWAFNQSGTMQELYTKYGPEGEVDAGKILPIFIEADERTTVEDLKGKGSMTQGDWVTGKDYPIVDMTHRQIAPFFRPETRYLNYPSFLMICPDRKVIFSQEGFAADMTADKLFEISQTCEPNPTSINELAQDAFIDIYPNPISDQLNISFNKSYGGLVFLKITNLSGIEVHNESINISSSGNYMVNMSSYASGMYFVTIDDGNELHVRRKFVKQ